MYNHHKESVANTFNENFTFVGRTTVDKIKALASECNSVKCEQIEQIIASLPSNKAPGFDKISAREIKDGLIITLFL